MEYYSAIKKNKLVASAATWVQLEIIILSKVFQKEKDKCHMTSLTCGSYNMIQMNISKEQKLPDEENRLVVARCGGGI